MGLNQNHNNNIEHLPVKHFMIVFLGFLVFITGLFLMGYSFFAWMLVSDSLQSLTYFSIGVLTCYLGRKIIRKMSKKQYIANVVE
ncbi:hypothetical protein [Glaciecola sp. KUL10]|uniref:hypothetical protein n=1 Tax=Glaciecola sp. (strain KUL10) TaxID=2161813 RepID=UPI000D788D05|nr:hypothetical protein [Glaciecola sp. KUL10]GBL04367.1 hypothetical protein KUL10_16730 [Glaciecola sp. KUL10]